MGFNLMVTEVTGCFVNVVDHFALFNFQKRMENNFFNGYIFIKQSKQSMTPPRVATDMAYPRYSH